MADKTFFTWNLTFNMRNARPNGIVLALQQDRAPPYTALVPYKTCPGSGVACGSPDLNCIDNSYTVLNSAFYSRRYFGHKTMLSYSCSISYLKNWTKYQTTLSRIILSTWETKVEQLWRVWEVLSCSLSIDCPFLFNIIATTIKWILNVCWKVKTLW